jgi:phage protein D
MAGTIARKAWLSLIYRGVDLGKYCTECEYTDNADSTIDELSVTLEDRERKWQTGWLPKKAEEISASIHCRDWFKPGDSLRLDCGNFTIDELHLEGPPTMVQIKAVSSRVKRSARIERKTKDHENKTLHQIAIEVAASAGLSLVWQGNNPHYDRVDQSNEADLYFLKRLCRAEGNSVKISGQKLIIYKGREYDGGGPHGTLKLGVDWLKHYDFNSKSHDLYHSCQVTYWQPDLKKNLVATYTPPNPPQTGEVLKINCQVKDPGEAMKKARSYLRAKNREETTTEIICVGDPRRRATQTLMVEGFGWVDGKYFVDQAIHSISGEAEYDTRLTLRKVLGY